MKPTIGIFPQLKNGGDVYIKPEYIRAVEESGARAVLLPLCVSEEQVCLALDTADAFIFAGGEDIAPEIYGEKRLPVCGESVALRDECELRAIRAVLASGRPLLGICRGFQLLNVALGGTLYQDIVSQRGGELSHRNGTEETEHEISVLPDTPLYSILGKERTQINSLHHQAVKELAPSLVAMATADDGIIEAAYRIDNSRVIGLQWHPERLFDGEDSKKIFTAFVKMATS